MSVQKPVLPMNMLLTLFALCWGLRSAAKCSTPINFVIWHGIGSSCCTRSEHSWIQRLLIEAFPRANVYSIGEDKHFLSDVADGFFGSMNAQVEQACSYLEAKKSIRLYGYHAIGISQGSQFVRGVIQRCGGLTAHSFLSVGGQHQGVYGLPKCSVQHKICRILRDVTDFFAHFALMQAIVIPAQYWHNPKSNHSKYRQYSAYLANINQETNVNPAYKQRFGRLRRLIMIAFNDDEYVTPSISSLFGYYYNASVVVQMEKMSTWNSLALDELHRDGRIETYRLPGRHMHMKAEWFKEKIVPVYSDLHEQTCNGSVKNRNLRNELD